MTIDDVHRQALRRLPSLVCDFLDGGADDETTLQRNRRAFGEIVLRPRILVDVSQRRLETVVLGERLALPVVLAPTGLAGLAFPRGEILAAEAACEAGTLLVSSSASDSSLEDVAARAGRPLWFQLYPWRDRNVTGALIDRARAAGYAALCVTADVPVVGGRERDVRNGFTIPPRVTPSNIVDLLTHPQWAIRMLLGPRVTLANLAELGGPNDVVSLARYVNESLVNPANDWEELVWIREQWSGPLLLKGVMTADDARLAIDHGIDGIVVSNHGGRQIDGAASTLAALREIRDTVDSDVELLVDGGVRRGSDVVKALALGASACLVGRPYWYGLAYAGKVGVTRVLQILRDEIDRTLALLGCPDVRQLGPQHIDSTALQ